MVKSAWSVGGESILLQRDPIIRLLWSDRQEQSGLSIGHTKTYGRFGSDAASNICWRT